MDTRIKIISNSEAARIAASSATVVSGYFDPMTREHADRLAGLKQPGTPLLVLIANPAAPILPSAARACLIAGLACVDYVTEIGAAFPSDLTPHVRLEDEDSARLDRLIQHVQSRQQAAQPEAAK